MKRSQLESMLVKENKFSQVKQSVKNHHICPLCKEKIEIGVEKETLERLYIADKFPYPHVHIHGDPLHAMLCYIDKDMVIRSTGTIKSIEISRDSETLNLLLKKWSNPY